MSNVFSLHGNTIPGTPNQDVIAELEEILAGAKAGDIQAFAIATVSGGSKGTGWAFGPGDDDRLAASIAALAFQFTALSLSVGDE